MDVVHRVLPVEGLGGREVRKRVKEMADGNFAARAVKVAVDAINMAVTSVIISSTTSNS
jgi:hypothetical protein